MNESNGHWHGLPTAFVVARYHDDGTAVFAQNEGIVSRADDAERLLRHLYAGSDIRRADCEHTVFQLWSADKETDTVWLVDELPLIGAP